MRCNEMKVLELCGSRNGVQGVKGSKEQSRIPDQLCEYVVELCEKGLNNKG